MNRAERRQLSSVPVPGSTPVKVSREVPVTIISGADGAYDVVKMETDEPCYGCKCCALWAQTIDTLRAAILVHDKEEHAVVPASWIPDCLVCQLMSGTADD